MINTFSSEITKNLTLSFSRTMTLGSICVEPRIVLGKMKNLLTSKLKVKILFENVSIL